jgi:hypothetical protein
VKKNAGVSVGVFYFALLRQIRGRYWVGSVVLSVPLTIILSGACALAQTQVTGTTCASSTTAGRKESTLPLIELLARLPKVM